MNEITDVANAFLNDQRQARQAAAGALEDNPDEAARAQQLSLETGVPASVIHGDLENFERIHKAQLNRELIDRNPHLQEYINSEPMAAKVSHDDFHNLDAATDAVKAVAGAGVEGFKHGFDYQGFLDEWQKFRDYIDNPLWKQFIQETHVEHAAVALGVMPRLFTGTVAGGASAIGEAFYQMSGSRAWADRLTRDMYALAQVSMAGQTGFPLAPELNAPAKMVQAAERLNKGLKAAEPWLENNQMPPRGVHEVFDEAWEQASKEDIKNLDDALRTASASKTRERSPELFSNLVKQIVGNGKIEISAEAVRKLYGKDVPTPDDGRLGWVPNLRQQLETAEATGGSIEVPLSEWLARVEPEIAKGLREDIRVRPQGMTLKEAEGLKEQKEKLLQQEEPRAALEEEPKEPEPINPVDAVRGVASLDEPLLEQPGVGRWADYSTIDFGEGVRAVVKKAEVLTEHENEIVDAVRDVFARVAPQLVDVHPVQRLQLEGKPIAAVYQTFDDVKPLVLFALRTRDPIGYARHEAIHHLKRAGFFTDKEWETLEKAAEDNDWIWHHRIDTRYKEMGYSHTDMLEEAIAEEYRDWADKKDLNQPHPAARIFEKLFHLASQIREAISRILGFEPNAEDLFTLVETGEIGRRAPTGELGTAFRAAKEEEPKPLFGRMAIGMNKRWQEKYFKLIEKRNAEDMEKQFKDAERDERKRQTEEWKTNAVKMYQEVSNDLEGRPDIAVGSFFESGILHGQKVSVRPVLDSSKLSPEQKAVLPKATYGRAGIDPDDLAGAFGLRSGDELVQILAQMQQAKGDLPFKEYVRQITAKEVDRRMRGTYGDIEENIMNEAVEHVIGNTQMDILHEELVGLGMRLNRELPFTKDDTKAFAKTKFDDTPVGQITVEKMLRDAGKAGTDAELALLDNKPEGAFQAKQKQYLSMRMAEEAKRFEKEERRFDKLMKQFSVREVKSVLPEYTNFIHQIMGQIGRPVRRSVQDLQQAIAQSGYRDLEHFVQEKENSLREMPVAEFLFDQTFKKQTDDMSIGEFRAVINSIKTLVHNGRDEMKIIREGEARDLEEVLTEMKGRLEDLGKDKAPRIDRPQSDAIRTIRTYWASSLTTESLLNRWDKDDPRGIFNRFITYPMAEAANHEARLIREFQKELREAVGDIKDIDKKITNDLFRDPLDGELFEMRKRNVLGILQNVGNKSNLEKLAKGYDLDPQQVIQWVIQHTTKEDWDRAQRIGDIFAKLSDMADNMAYNLSGVTFEKLQIESIQTPFGLYRGWYNPIKYDPNRPGRSKRLIGPNALEEEGYFRAATPQGYTKGRTGYIAPVELNLDVVPMRIKQMIHDISFRPAVVQVSKVFYDSSFQRSVVKNYGEVYAKQLLPYLKDVANYANSMSDAAHTGNRAIEWFRQNLIATLIGFNPHTVAKHGMTAAMNSLTEVGPVNFMRELSGLMMNSEEAGKTNWRFAMEHSEELQRRMRNWSELIQGQPELSLMGASPRQFLISAGSTPVAVGDLLSAVPTWLARYRSAIEEGADHGQAVAESNRAVRRAHGSSAITNRAQIMRSNALGATFSSLYGFFSHMLQKQFELSWKAADSFQGLKAGDLTEAKRHAPALLMGLISYVIFPAVVEELVTPYSGADRDSWGVKAVKVLGKGMASSLIGVRDFVDGFINTREGGAGLIPTAFKAIYDIGRDLGKGKKVMNREEAGRAIKHAFTAMGALTGLTNAQEGRTAEWLYRYHKGLEHPKGPMDWARGMTRGTLKEYRR